MLQRCDCLQLAQHSKVQAKPQNGRRRRSPLSLFLAPLYEVTLGLTLLDRYPGYVYWGK